MHGRVVSVQVKPEDLGEAISIYRDSVVPAAQDQDGFNGAILLTDPDTGKAISVTLWNSEEDLLKGQESGYYQEQIAKFTDLLIRKPDQVGYEVSLSVGSVSIP